MSNPTSPSSPPAPVSSISYQNNQLLTANMAIFLTAQPSLPFIYLTADGIFFLQSNRAQWEEPRVRRIPRHEAARIANLYNVESLKKALVGPVISAESAAIPSTPLSALLSSNDPELIKQVHGLTPDQLEKLSQSLQPSTRK